LHVSASLNATTFMGAYYIIIVGFLFILAISLLIVGVSNDAVNFLNSAIGSKAASFQVVLFIAAIGVLIGATFSNGMMEVARKGIFNPQYFAFDEIMVIFMAVMLTNLLLLDFFNTFGLPTSTTISIVFGLLGSAVAVSIWKIARADVAIENVGSYINLERSVMIIAGIFLSVIIAFNAGIIIQWIVRLAFSFNLGKTSRYWSGVWGGFAITAILYFLLIKGIKGSTLLSDATLAQIRAHTAEILLISFAGWTLLFQVLVLFTRVNVLKITVLAGTFALAMAFAGNDLVNFIGVPLAGFESFKAVAASGTADAGSFLMSTLQEPVDTPILFLIAAGLIMVLTLRFSKKAISVTATTINLSRQSEGVERFGSSTLARFIVRRSLELSNGILRITPPAVTRYIGRRFDAEVVRDDPGHKLAFDQVRASVNLVVASILIAIGTSLKLPLSTTYVTFMVAMGTSLADGAWGRDSAVYRISGVLTVIGGWFFTAFTAFLASFLIATMIFFGRLPVILLLIGLAVYILLRTHAFHREKTRKEAEAEPGIITASHEILISCNDTVKNTLVRVSGILQLTYTNFWKERHKELKNLKKESKQLSRDIKEIQDKIPQTLKRFREPDLEHGHHYVQIVAYMREMCNSLMHIVLPAFTHLDNNHAFDREHTDDLKAFIKRVGDFFTALISLLGTREYDRLDQLVLRRDELINLANDIILKRIRILKKTQKGVKISATYIEMLSETKNLLLNAIQLVKSNGKLLESMTSRETVPEEMVLD
jgi:phosphate/sulfate permease